MADTSDLPELDQLVGAYFNQDFDLWGDTVEEIIAAYKEGSSPERQQSLRAEIDAFVSMHPNDLEAAFAARYNFDFSPEAWGHTTISFLRAVQALLR